MNQATLHMQQVLRERIVPLLHERNFTGHFPHFRRLSDKQIDLLSFQFSKWGYYFYLEAAVCSPDGAYMLWGEKVAPNDVRAVDILDVSKRTVLGTRNGDCDFFYFVYEEREGNADNYFLVASQVLSLLNQAEAWWRKMAMAHNKTGEEKQ
ncbi:DUF4304 domain-containing protein [Aneurinibacillus sp. REN35]|uniref:DUF4304 domain-containing protein n=1 Tax=Aneurinibacillus sp. REN35 TaxID=3237286 RepID=UPI0035295A97